MSRVLRSSDMRDLAKLMTEFTGFVYYAPRRYNHCPSNQMRRYLRRGCHIVEKELIHALVKLDTVKSQIFFYCLIYLGMERSSEMLETLLSLCIKEGKYRLIQEANRMHLVGRNELRKRIPLHVYKELRIANALPKKQYSIYLVLKAQDLWHFSGDTPYTAEEVDRYIEENSFEWLTYDIRGLIDHSIAYGDLEAFRTFYNLACEKQISLDDYSSLIWCITLGSLDIFQYYFPLVTIRKKEERDGLVKCAAEISRKKELYIMKEHGYEISEFAQRVLEK